MNKILNMQFIRYLNLFYKITKIRCNHCFQYNNTILFAIPRPLIMKALSNNQNLEKLSKIIGKKIKVIAIPRGKEDIENFVSMITRPVKFKGVEIKNEEVIINAPSQSKASLIGKNKIRLDEMENILGQYFGIRKVMVR